MDPSALKTPPSYAIASVDHALRLAAVLQLEGGLTVTAAAERLGVARSTAHRVLQMLVYRDFARQDDERIYRPGLLLELAAYSPTCAADLRKASLPYLERLSETFGESVNVSIQAGETTRFIASVECRQPMRVTSREGMVFPLHRTTTGMLYLASLPDQDLRGYLDRHPDSRRGQRRSMLDEVERVRRCGFALNLQRSEMGLVAVGVPIPRLTSGMFAGLSVSLPTVRYDERRIEWYVSVLRATSAALSTEMTDWARDVEPAV